MSQRAEGEVYKKQLTATEQAVILAMLEIAGGATANLHIRIPRIAAYAKLDERSVQRALWGDHRIHPGQPKPRGMKGKPEPECPFCKGLVQRRVLQQLSPANWRTRSAATYRLNIEILDDCEAVKRYLDQRRLNFPETKKPTVALDPASHGRGVQRPMVAGPGDPRSGDPASHGRTDSKALDSRAMNTMTAAKVCNSCNPSIDRSVISQVLSRYCPNCDQAVPDRIIQGVLNERADARTEEILHFLAVKGQQSSSNRIENPAGFLIATVPACFTGTTFEEWRRRQQADVQAAERQAAADAEMRASIVGKCQGCGRTRLAGSSWSDYCADSCRDAHKRATA